MASKAAEEQRLDPDVPGNSVVPVPGRVISGPLVGPGEAVGLVSLLPYNACRGVDTNAYVCVTKQICPNLCR